MSLLKINHLHNIFLLTALIAYSFSCDPGSGKGNNAEPAGASAEEKVAKVIAKTNDINILAAAITDASGESDLKKLVDELAKADTAISEAEAANPSEESKQKIASAKERIKEAKDKVVGLVRNTVKAAHTEVDKQHAAAKTAHDSVGSDATKLDYYATNSKLVADTKAAHEAADKAGDQAHKYARLLKGLNTDDAAKVIKDADAAKTKVAEAKGFATKATETYLSALKKNKLAAKTATEDAITKVKTLTTNISNLKFTETYDFSNAQQFEKEIEAAKKNMSDTSQIQAAKELIAVFKEIADKGDANEQNEIATHEAAIKSADDQVQQQGVEFKEQAQKIARALKAIATDKLKAVKDAITAKDSATAQAAQLELKVAGDELSKFVKLTNDIKGPVTLQLNDVHEFFSSIHNIVNGYVKEGDDAIAALPAKAEEKKLAIFFDMREIAPQEQTPMGKVMMLLRAKIEAKFPSKIDFIDTYASGALALLPLFSPSDRPPSLDKNKIDKWHKNTVLLVMRQSTKADTTTAFSRVDPYFKNLTIPPLTFVYFQPMEPDPVYIHDSSETEVYLGFLYEIIEGQLSK